MIFLHAFLDRTNLVQELIAARRVDSTNFLVEGPRSGFFLKAPNGANVFANPAGAVGLHPVQKTKFSIIELNQKEAVNEVQIDALRNALRGINPQIQLPDESLKAEDQLKQLQAIGERLTKERHLKERRERPEKPDRRERPGRGPEPKQIPSPAPAPAPAPVQAPPSPGSPSLDQIYTLLERVLSVVQDQDLGIAQVIEELGNFDLKASN